jgi:hypothetical protein
LHADLEQQAADLGVAGSVHFVAGVPTDDVPGVLAEHDLLVHLADVETFGMTMVEAVISGVPVLATRSGGPEETLAQAAALHAARFVPRRPSRELVAQHYRSLRRDVPDADWLTIRRLLEYRYAPATIGRELVRHLDGASDGVSAVPWGRTLGISVGGKATSTLQPLLDQLASVGSRTEVVDLGARPHWASRHPRSLAARVQQLVANEHPDLLVVDEFVSAALPTVRAGLPPTVSVSQPARLWRHLSQLLGDKPGLTPLTVDGA